MRTLAVICLPMLLGKVGIFFAEPAAWVGADVVLVISYFSAAKRLEVKMTDTVEIETQGADV